MKILRMQRLQIVVALFFLLATLFLAPVSARAEAGQALSISPPVMELGAEPGKQTTVSIKLTNISSGELLIKNQINDFGAKNETGEPNIIFDDNPNTSYSLRSWVESPAPFRLASKESRTVNFTVNVPANAEPGGHYGVFRFTGQAPELEESGVSLSASIGSLVLLRVAGDIQEKATVASFYSATPSFAQSSFFEYGPIGFVERIQNQGNVHEKPTGTVEVFDLFGRKVDTIPVNGQVNDPKDPPKSVLPNSVRRFEQLMPKKWLFGPYTAKLNLTYGASPQTLQAQTMFWVIPYKLILLILFIVVGGFFLFRWLMRRYNRRIIAKATGEKPVKKSKPAKDTVLAEPTTPKNPPAAPPPKRPTPTTSSKPAKRKRRV